MHHIPFSNHKFERDILYQQPASVGILEDSDLQQECRLDLGSRRLPPRNDPSPGDPYYRMIRHSSIHRLLHPLRRGSNQLLDRDPG